MSDKTNENRKKRIRILKKVAAVFLLAAVFVPTAASVWLVMQMNDLKIQIAQMQEKTLEAEGAWTQAIEMWEDDTRRTKEEQGPEMLTEEDSIRAWEEQEAKRSLPQETVHSGIRKVYLTFDDGPSIYTDQILDILKEYDVKATFFVVAEGKEEYEDAYRRILDEGHTLGMHSYSHVYKEIYRSKESFIRDVNELQDYIYEVTGEYPDIYRFPGGSSNRVSTVDMEELKGYLAEIGVSWYDWNVSSGDATGHLGKDQIVRNSTANLARFDEAVILLHDTGDKRTTVEALPEIIETILKMEDTVIVPIMEDTSLIHHGQSNS